LYAALFVFDCVIHTVPVPLQVLQGIFNFLWLINSYCVKDLNKYFIRTSSWFFKLICDDPVFLFRVDPDSSRVRNPDPHFKRRSGSRRCKISPNEDNDLQ
jgi:hypothetical protein